jgi:KUP system potassium uptake protein
VEPEQRVTIEPLGRGFFRVIASYGFMEGPHVPELIESCVARGMLAPGLMMTFFMGRETLVTTSHGGMSPLGKRLFGFLSRNAYRATDYFKIPSDQVIEIGTVVEL